MISSNRFHGIQYEKTHKAGVIEEKLSEIDTGPKASARKYLALLPQ